jgi:N-acetylglucosamine transport system permease protein
LNRAIRVFFLILAVLPLAWVVVSSLKPGADILASPWSLPTTLRWDNFGKAWSEAGIGKAFLNSLLVTVATLLILMPISAMAAYVLAR